MKPLPTVDEIRSKMLVAMSVDPTHLYDILERIVSNMGNTDRRVGRLENLIAPLEDDDGDGTMYDTGPGGMSNSNNNKDTSPPRTTNSKLELQLPPRPTLTEDGTNLSLGDDGGIDSPQPNPNTSRPSGGNNSKKTQQLGSNAQQQHKPGMDLLSRLRRLEAVVGPMDPGYHAGNPASPIRRPGGAGGRRWDTPDYSAFRPNNYGGGGGRGGAPGGSSTYGGRGGGRGDGGYRQNRPDPLRNDLNDAMYPSNDGATQYADQYDSERDHPNAVQWNRQNNNNRQGQQPSQGHEDGPSQPWRSGEYGSRPSAYTTDGAPNARGGDPRRDQRDQQQRHPGDGGSLPTNNYPNRNNNNNNKNNNGGSRYYDASPAEENAWGPGFNNNNNNNYKGPTATTSTTAHTMQSRRPNQPDSNGNNNYNNDAQHQHHQPHPNASEPNDYDDHNVIKPNSALHYLSGLHPTDASTIGGRQTHYARPPVPPPANGQIPFSAIPPRIYRLEKELYLMHKEDLQLLRDAITDLWAYVKTVDMAVHELNRRTLDNFYKTDVDAYNNQTSCNEKFLEIFDVLNELSFGAAELERKMSEAGGSMVRKVGLGQIMPAVSALAQRMRQEMGLPVGTIESGGKRDLSESAFKQQIKSVERDAGFGEDNFCHCQE